MKDKTNFKKNTVLALAYQIVAACIGFIMPRFFITAYGSTINGSISTISQLAGFLGLLEAGMGSVASVAFYRSLEEMQNVVLEFSGDFAVHPEKRGTLCVQF